MYLRGMSQIQLKKLFYTILVIFIWSPGLTQSDKCNSGEFDHIVFFVSDTTIQTGMDSIFTFGRELSTHHIKQGTYSHFYLVYNSFIEFIYTEDEEAIQRNTSAFGSDYGKRWSNNDSVCKIGIGLIHNTPDSSCYHVYHAEVGHYLMSKHNSNPSGPMIYTSDSSQAYQEIDSLEQLRSIHPPRFADDFIRFNTHPSGIKKLSKLIIYKPDYADSAGFNQLLEYPNIEIKSGNRFQYILEFDNWKQGKCRVISPWLEIRY